MANYATSAFKVSDTYVNTLPYNTCSTAAGTAAKTVDASSFALETGAMVVVKFTVTNTAANPTLNVSSTGAKAIYYNGAAITAGYLKANKVYQFIYNGTQWDLVGDVDTDTNTNTNYYHTPTVSATGSNLTGNSGSSNTKIGTGSGVSDMYVPVATANAPGTTVVYPAASCTTFTSDAGTVTPYAVKKAGFMFPGSSPFYTGKSATVSSGVHTITINQHLPALPSSGYWLIPVLVEFASNYTSGNTIKVKGTYGGFSASTSFTTSTAATLKTMQNTNAPTNSFISSVPNMVILKFTASGVTGAWINSTAIWA